MVTGYGTIETAVEALKYGAFDYITKPFKVDELLITVQRAIEYNKTISENIDLKAQLTGKYKFENIIAESHSMRNVCEMIERVAPTDAAVLIYGESGTGKELVAKAIHAYSTRKTKKFLPLNCAALPEPLLESELFGHVKGSFTDSIRDKKGKFELAGDGTIFLDEISEISLFRISFNCNSFAISINSPLSSTFFNKSITFPFVVFGIRSTCCGLYAIFISSFFTFSKKPWASVPFKNDISSS